MMFEIEYKGGNSVVIATKKARLVSDPKLSTIGLKDELTKDCIELATEKRFVVGSSDALLNIEGPGEYEVSDFSIRGIAAQRHIDTADQRKASTSYRIEVGDTRIALVGNIAGKLSEQQLEEIGVIDILIIPVGGNGYTLDATDAAKLTRQMSPKVVIPIHYADSTLDYEVPQDTLELFKKEIGGDVEQTQKFKVKTAGALPSVLTLVELTRS